jgi:hypothetical protein
MWICPRCGEPHQDQFKECWKCVGAEMESAGAEPDPQTAAATPSERPLRSIGAITFRIAVGFGVGMLAGMAVFHRYGASLTQAASLGAVLGTIVGLIVGVLLWVVFPFQPTATPTEPPDSK